MSKSRRGRPATQEAFAKKVGITQPDVSKLLAKGVLTRGATVDQWVLEYCRNLRFQAAQHKAEDGSVDRVKEAALLDRRKREELEMKLAERRKELWPVNAIAAALHQHNTNAKNRWLALPNNYKSLRPHLNPVDIDVLDRLCRENLIEQAHDQLPPDILRMVQRYWEELHATAQADGESVGGPTPVFEPGIERDAGKMENGSDAVSPKNNGRSE